MGLRDFLYPQLEVRLILARALDVDLVQAGQGSLSKEYKDVAARISVSEKDAQRLGIKENSRVEVHSTTGKVIVSTRIDEKAPEGIVVMQPSPWSFALIPASLPYQGITVTIKPTKAKITKIDELP